MKIVLVTPAPAAETSGNSVTANRWQNILRTLGHQVSITTEWSDEHCDALIALHARRSHSSVESFRKAHPDRPLIVALAGTDLYSDLPDNSEALHSLSIATRVVVLQSAALDQLDDITRAKTRIIYQSAVPPAYRPKPADDRFDVCVLSHLREVKDPLRAAFASRLLPEASKIRIVHAGRALDPKWMEAARQQERENSRYRWIDEQSHEAGLQLLSRCRLLVLSSTMEGGANAIAEAVVCGIPILCSDIPGNVGMLDRKYPGFFRTGDTEQLSAMLYRAEIDADFLGRLADFIHALQERFAPEREVACWSHLLQLTLSKSEPGGSG
ncbi:MAG TPA: selenoneine biosynthesis selenosugar synthase SenB [Terriglobia bacterium]|nr:selenoneine biosynthesis selenosugar synthase SenB [Terriglobia bacterium]